MSQTAIVIKGGNRNSASKLSLDPNIMVTSIRGTVNCPDSVEHFNSQDSKVGIVSFPCDFDHMYASMSEGMASPKEKNEYKHLKEICLQHLDLIQQQSELIAKQEKQLQSLRQENDTLKQRLNRMDRRVVLQKSTGDIDTDADTLSNRSLSRSYARSPASPNSILSHKRPLSVNIGDLSCEETCHSPVQWGETFAHRAQSEDGAASISSGFEMHDDSSCTTVSQRSAPRTKKVPTAAAGGKGQGKRTLSCGSRENSVSSRVYSRSDSSDRRPVKKAKKLNEDRSLGSNSPVYGSALLTTSEPYFTATGSSDSNWNIEEMFPESDSDVNGEMLEIPQWRVKHYTSLYSMEGTENLDDEVFNKRHQRLEVDERRRKRWDVQRIREQRHIDKLRQRELGGSSAAAGSSGADGLSEEAVSSLWPCPDDAEVLEIADELPVAAFGVPIAKFTPSDFSLPWLKRKGCLQPQPSSSKPIKRRRSAPGSTARRNRVGRGGSRSSLHIPSRTSDMIEKK